MQFRFQLDERPPLKDLFLFGLQWLAIAVPTIVIIGGVVAPLHFTAPVEQILYLQKLALVAGLTMGAQILWGHRLPLVTGPAAVLLIGVVASRESLLGVIYGSLFASALILTLLAGSGLFRHLIKLFTPRVVAVVLLLIAFTLLPTIRNLLVHPGGTAGPLAGLSFTAVLVLLLLAGQFWLRGIWKATLIVWGMLSGSLVWLLLYPQSLTLGNLPVISLPLYDWALPGFAFDLGVLLAFLCCFLALAVNDLGSIQSMTGLLQPPGMPSRINRGLIVTGIGNLLAGALGVIGPVNYSLSPGVIAATGCASRYALLPTAGGLVLLALSPQALALLGAVPPVVVGAILLYILSSQVSAGLLALLGGEGALRFEDGLVVALPLLFGTLTAFLPLDVVAGFPTVLRPVLGNGFVIGTLLAILLDFGLGRGR